MKQKFIICIICIIGFGFYSTGYCINGVLLDGQGARCGGMGSANIAATDDSTGIINNPGTLFVHDHGNMDLGFAIAYPSLNFKNALNNKNGESVIISSPSASFTTKPYNERFKFGIGFFPMGGLGAEYRLLNPIYGEQVYKVDMLFVKLMPAVAYKVNDDLSIGISAGIGYQDLRFKDPSYELHSGYLKGAPVAVDIQADGMDYCYNLGAVYRVNDNLKIGVVYKSETKIELSGVVNGSITPVIQNMLTLSGMSPGDAAIAAIASGSAKYDIDIDFTFPQSFGIGLAYQVNDDFLMAADIEWINWSDAFDKIPFGYLKGNNPYLPPTLADALPVNFDDQYVFRIGAEYKTTEKLTLRCGLNYGKSPVPDNTLFPLMATIVETSGTIGIGYKYFDNIVMDLGYQRSFQNKQSIVGESLVSSGYDNSSCSVAVDTFFIGLTVVY